ncbi:MAG: alpha/beta hydrolase [Opitutaceae bacterium]|nr:alpha/beta hydrolase [Opitutaceae bacterium]
MCWLLLSLAVASAVLSLLNWRPAPHYAWAWKTAILAGEYGHRLALLPLATALAAGGWLDGGWRLAVWGVSALALAGLLRPVCGAWRLARRLPRALDDAFGPRREPPPPLAAGRLLAGRAVKPAAMRTEVFARHGGTELALDFYGPASGGGAAAPPRPCVMVIHGGGWDGGDRRQLADWNHRLVAEGYAVAAVSYRLAPAWVWPAQREDLAAALGWIRSRASELGVDPARLVLLGRSAGGQLATAVGYGLADSSVCGVIALYGPHDMPFAWSVSREDDALNSIKLIRQYLGGPPDTPEARARYESASGQLLARPDSPPTLLIHGRLDTLAWYRHSERLAVRLRELGIRHYHLELPWATHAFDYNPDGPGGQLADHAIRHFLQAVTRSRLSRADE